MSAADEHRLLAAGLTAVVDRTTRWDAPAPVEGWLARDVVEHLVTWLPGFLAAGGVELGSGVTPETVAADPAASWHRHADAVQTLLDGPDASRPFTHPHVGEHPLDAAIGQFYVADVFMHTWDLARAAGLEPALDEERCAAMLAGMEPIEEMLRASGQYGARVDVPEDALVQDRFVAFIGRDPAWTPPS